MGPEPRSSLVPSKSKAASRPFNESEPLLRGQPEIDRVVICRRKFGGPAKSSRRRRSKPFRFDRKIEPRPFLRYVGIEHSLLYRALLCIENRNNFVRRATIMKPLQYQFASNSMIERHFDDHRRPMSRRGDDVAGGVNRKGCRVVIRMRSFVGVGEYEFDAMFDDQTGQPPRHIDKVKRSLLVGNLTSDSPIAIDTGNIEGVFEFTCPLSPVIVHRQDRVRAGRGRRARGAVGDMNKAHAIHAVELPANANRLVVGMGNHYQDAAGLDRRVLIGGKHGEKLPGILQAIFGSAGHAAHRSVVPRPCRQPSRRAAAIRTGDGVVGERRPCPRR